MNKRFRDLKIGEHFIFNDVTWVKVKTKYKNCCNPLYNAHQLENIEITALIGQTTKVKV
jgi:hypothetical protein